MSLTTSELSQLQIFSVDLADAAKRIILDLWQHGSFQEELKEDQTPVSIVDLKAEECIRDMIQKRYPTHGIIGEEFPAVNPESEFQWTVDPIDGTQNLINKIPTFGTLIGLRFRGRAVLGLIDHPVLNLRTVGGAGLGVLHNGLKVSLGDMRTSQLSASDLVATNNPSVFGRSPDATELFAKVISFHPHSRIYYDCYAHTLALLGSLAVVVEPNLKIWDVTPVEAMMHELGGGCLRFGRSEPNGKVELINSIFGKKSAVELVGRYLGVV